MLNASAAAKRSRAARSDPAKTAVAASAAISTANANGLNSTSNPNANPASTSQTRGRTGPSARASAYKPAKNSGSDGVHVLKCSTSIVGARKLVGHSSQSNK